MTQGLVLLEERIRVALVGEFSAGKSTLFNSLVGRRLSEVGAVPTTTDALIATAPGHVRGLPNDVRVRTRGPLWSRGAALIDTPGLNSDTAEHRSKALALARDADIVLWAIRASDVSHRSALADLNQFRNNHKKGCVAVLVTHVDPEDFEDEEDQEDFLNELSVSLGSGPRFLLDGRDLGVLDGPQVRGWLNEQVEKRAHRRLLAELQNAHHGAWLTLDEPSAQLVTELQTEAVMRTLDATRSWWHARERAVQDAAVKSASTLAGMGHWALHEAVPIQLISLTRSIIFYPAGGGNLLSGLNQCWPPECAPESLGVELEASGSPSGKALLKVRCITMSDLSSVIRRAAPRCDGTDSAPQITVLVRTRERELGAAWSLLGLDSSGAAGDDDWPRLARMVAERWTDTDVLLFDPKNPQAHDGPRLLEQLLVCVSEYARGQLPRELARDSEHWLRLWLRDYPRGWREALPPVLHPGDTSLLDALEQARDAARVVWEAEQSDAGIRARDHYQSAVDANAGHARARLSGIDEQGRQYINTAPTEQVGSLFLLNSALLLVVVPISMVASLVSQELSGVSLNCVWPVEVAAILLGGLVAAGGNLKRPFRRSWTQRVARGHQKIERWRRATRAQEPPPEWLTFANYEAETNYRDALGIPPSEPPEHPEASRPLISRSTHPETFRRYLLERLPHVVSRRRTGILIVTAALSLSTMVVPNAVDVHHFLETKGGTSGETFPPEVLLERARQHIQTNETSAAVLSLESCLRQAPDHASCRWELGWAYWKREEWDEVVAVWSVLEEQHSWPEAELKQWLSKAREHSVEHTPVPESALEP